MSVNLVSRELAAWAAPMLRVYARLLVLPAVASTVQPRDRANWIAAIPTPPAPACTSTCTGPSSAHDSQKWLCIASCDLVACSIGNDILPAEVRLSACASLLSTTPVLAFI